MKLNTQRVLVIVDAVCIYKSFMLQWYEPSSSVPHYFEMLLQVGTLIFVAEWGDRSMLATIALGAAHPPVGMSDIPAFLPSISQIQSLKINATCPACLTLTMLSKLRLAFYAFQAHMESITCSIWLSLQYSNRSGDATRNISTKV